MATTSSLQCSPLPCKRYAVEVVFACKCHTVDGMGNGLPSIWSMKSNQIYHCVHEMYPETGQLLPTWKVHTHGHPMHYRDSAGVAVFSHMHGHPMYTPWVMDRVSASMTAG